LARRLLINAQKPEELRIAILDGDCLEGYQVEVGEGGAKRGNVYRGIVTNVQPSLNAAFVDFGDPKNGFLSVGDLVEDSWTRKPKKGGRPRIDEILEKGKPILVQVQKDMEGKKGSGLTTDISLAGRYLVFTPFDDKIGISRKVEDDDTRKKLREIASGLDIPEGGGLIIRTNALEQNKTTINRDFKALLRLWKKIRADFKKGKTPEMLHNDQEIVIRTLRDFVDANITEILVDTDDAYDIATEYMQVSMPRSKTKLVRYADREPLFSRFKLESQIDGIYDRRVGLRSGGSIVVDRTEALTAVDVNSGRSTRAGSQEETAYHTNLEAAREIARQLRLRDIGGLIVVDFIDMKSRSHRAAVEKELKEAMKVDRARHTIGRISSNGLVEINRQRIRKELNLQTHRPCPTCEGTGRIASVEMVGLNLLRRIESHAATTNLERVRIELHPELADAVQNGRRQQITDLEREFGITVEIIASNRLHRPEQLIDWVTASESHEEPPHRPRTETPVHTEHASEGEEGTKRRRRRKKKAGGEPVAVAEPAPGQAYNREPDEEIESSPMETEPVATDAPAPEKAKRSRRRRKKKPSGESAAVAEPAPDRHEEEPEAEAEILSGAAEPGASDTPGIEKAKRSRRRRRKKKSAEGAAAVPADAGHPEAGRPLESEFWVVPETGHTEESEAKPARSSRRRPSGGGNASEESVESEAVKPSGDAPGEANADAGGEASGAPAKKRRPRRRSRRKPSTDSGNAGAGVSSPSDES
jgi:ribonuclease E